MEFEVTRFGLRNAINAVIGAVPSRPMHLALLNILVEANEDSLVISAFDLNVAIQYTLSDINYQPKKPGSLSVPAKLFHQMINSQDEANLLINVKDSVMTIEVENKKSTYKIVGLDSTEAIALPQKLDVEAISISTKEFADAVKRITPSISNDETKAILTGFHVKTTNGYIELVSTDGHRLSLVKIDYEGVDFEFTAPGLIVKEIAKFTSDTFDMKISESHIELTSGATRVSCRLLDGQYPQYSAIIPKQFETELVLDKKSFISCLKRVGILADPKTSLILLKVDDSAELKVSVEAKEVSSGYECLPLLDVSGPSIEFALNLKYLMEGLQQMPGNDIKIVANSPLAPVILKPLGFNALYLTMPIQIRN